MTLRRTALHLSVEREVEGTDGRTERVRLMAALEGEPAEGELPAALARLRADWESAVGVGREAPRPDRSLQELVEIYRPRQIELVELLRADREISETEAERLRVHLATGGVDLGPPREPAPAPVAPPLDRPLAALPLAVDRAPSTPRPIAELLELYRIESLRQAGAVRARRQISYEEYMALKRHFAAAEAQADAAARAGAAAPSERPSGAA